MTLVLNSKTQQEFDYEASLLKRLEHPNIVRLYGVVKPKNEKPIVLEHYEQGSLYHVLYKSDSKIVLSFEIKRSGISWNTGAITNNIVNI